MRGTLFISLPPVSGWDHPRTCGEHTKSSVMLGLEDHPAHAGNTRQARSFVLLSGITPHMRGETHD